MRRDKPHISIMVRSRVQSCESHSDGSPRFYTEWHETTRSWKKAWRIVDECADRSECRKWRTNDQSAYWFLDIGGVDERATCQAWHQAFMERMGEGRQ